MKGFSVQMLHFKVVFLISGEYKQETVLLSV